MTWRVVFTDISGVEKSTSSRLSYQIFEAKYARSAPADPEVCIEVNPTQQDAGGCGTSLHPLDPFYVFSGGDQQHCRCDVGLCRATDEWITLQPGTYELTAEWSGRNWQGPSDTGNQPGEYFPPGTYDFEVSTVGEYRDANDQVMPYEVSSTMEFQLVD